MEEKDTTKDDRKKYGTLAYHYTQGVDVTTECIHIRFSKNYLRLPRHLKHTGTSSEGNSKRRPRTRTNESERPCMKMLTCSSTSKTDLSCLFFPTRCNQWVTTPPDSKLLFCWSFLQSLGKAISNSLLVGLAHLVSLITIKVLPATTAVKRALPRLFSLKRVKTYVRFNLFMPLHVH